MPEMSSVSYYWGHKNLAAVDRHRRGEVHCLSRSTFIGQIVSWGDGRMFKITRTLDDRLAGGYRCGDNARWFEAEPYTKEHKDETP